MAYKTVNLKDGRTASFDWLRPDDLTEIMSVYNSVVKEESYLFETNEISSLEEEQKWFEQRRNEGVLYLVARVNGKVAGGASLNPRTGKSAHIVGFGIFIGKNYRDVGLGTALTQELVKVAKEKGYEIVRLVVFESNKRAFHVYKSCGFKPVGRLTRDIKFPDATYTDRIPMEQLF